jgi:ATP-dependent RNA helicase RhlE
MPFSAYNLHPEVARGVADLGYTRPTPIQAQAIPPVLEGRDIVACAMTGSGKTAAFALPILHRLATTPRKGLTRALILSPTRELAAQIEQSFRDLGRHAKVSSAAIFGGVGMVPQEQALRRGLDVIVATPGRLLDHMQNPSFNFPGLEVLVLDEADRMLDMGFLPDVKRILKRLPIRRQTLLFSATMPAPIAMLAKEMLRDAVTVAVDKPSTAAKGVTHAAYPVPAELKSALLVELLKRGQINSVIAFTRTKHRANRLADYLTRAGVNAERIHGNRSQAQRTQALAGFKAGKFPVLVATDIAARGIDVEALSHVVNFDVPASPEDYVHRVGRTARAEQKGDAFVFVSPEEEADVRGIERALGARLPRVTVEGFDYTRRSVEKLEVPLSQRLAEHRARQKPRSGQGPRPGGPRPHVAHSAPRPGSGSAHTSHQTPTSHRPQAGAGNGRRSGAGRRGPFRPSSPSR